MIGDFALNSGEVIQILVGQQGDAGGTGPSGGSGGSYVVRTPYTTTTSILVIAGGGSGAGNYSFTPGVSTSTGQTGGVAGGTNGNGGSGGTRGAGGGGGKRQITHARSPPLGIMDGATPGCQAPPGMDLTQPTPFPLSPDQLADPAPTHVGKPGKRVQWVS